MNHGHFIAFMGPAVLTVSDIDVPLLDAQMVLLKDITVETA